MHRCGTSVVAKVLYEMGLDLGPCHQFMPANNSNQLGYFENQWLSYEVNDVLLSHLGGKWDKPPTFPDGWEQDEVIQKLTKSTKRYFENNFAGSHRGWKDPRTSLLIPFWKNIFPELRFIVCLRNPIEVAHSLSRRESFNHEKGISLWFDYVSSIVRELDNHQQTHFVFYENLIEDPEREIYRLGEYCGLQIPAALTAQDGGVFSQLQHHFHEDGDLEQKTEKTKEALSLYQSLRERFAAADASPPGQSRQKVDATGDSRIRLVVPKCDKPLVSIVIPTYNRADMLMSCIQAVVSLTDVPYELIIVDDCSSDSTQQVLKNVENAKIVRNRKNLDFLRSANKGADQATGNYILFLNNDVIVRVGWLSKLVSTIEEYPECAAVGPKFLNFDGSLQEAGAYVMHDGKVVMYGSSKGAFQPEFNYMREVDYCSAACLLVRADLFRQVGGLDTRYVPAYYEDPDLCFQLKSLGYKVVYQPEAVVFHHHVGSRPYSKAKELVTINREKFREKWLEELSSRENSEQPLRGRDRRTGHRVLVIVDRIPDIESSDSKTIKLLKLLIEQKHVVTLLPTKEKYTHQPSTQAFQQLGIEVFYGGYLNPVGLIHHRPNFYETIYIIGADENSGLEDAIRQKSEKSKILTLEDAFQSIQ